MVTILQRCLLRMATKNAHQPKQAIATGSTAVISSTAITTRFTTFTGLATVIGDCRQRNRLASVEADLGHHLEVHHDSATMVVRVAANAITRLTDVLGSEAAVIRTASAGIVRFDALGCSAAIEAITTTTTTGASWPH